LVPYEIKVLLILKLKKKNKKQVFGKITHIDTQERRVWKKGTGFFIYKTCMQRGEIRRAKKHKNLIYIHNSYYVCYIRRGLRKILLNNVKPNEPTKKKTIRLE